MKIDLALMAGNPLSTNYLTFFATIRSWAPSVDNILWLDSGTNDESLEQFGHGIREKIRIVSDFRTNWSLREGFSPNAINSMINAGIQESEADWLIIIGADFVLNRIDNDLLKAELLKYHDVLWTRFTRKKIELGKHSDYSEVLDTRGTVCLNMRMARSLSYFPYLYGIDKNSMFLSDYPLAITDFAGLRKSNGVEIVPFGEHQGFKAPLLKSLDVFVADHFFYKSEQAIQQRLLFQRYFNSYANGTAPYRRLEAQSIVGFEKSRWSKKELLELPYPIEFKDVIKEFYTDDMLGGVVFRKDRLTAILFVLCRLERRFRDVLFRYDSSISKMVMCKHVEDAINKSMPFESLHS